MFKGGDTFLIRTRAGEGGQPLAHLHVILIDVDAETDSTIVVNIETMRNSRQDQTTLLDAGEHEFVVKRSCVVYRRARILDGATIRDLVKRGEAIPRPILSAEVLERVRQGVRKSRYTPEAIREFYETHFMYRRADRPSST
jgi:hypothetical protein